ncbi:bifunctional 2-keto-4-hydroxyglutarate aldolase/2-keto-3-deoxy-6-phosphogluconate aldolase [Vagococcus elongatus]|uniref:2-dehydro-3-deoxyphosphogluconate aldolase n=1 Tax=Vagococcus elongatus TaxID=180344 RepID=A0A430B1C3_9ENTE|nr:bifunctional 2-keto-4-hydroxyglutarate aldolase/2-keto-3-deoxy-6-phosphogluconate aldolase [Vagococcus elongatus]RSU14022.1 2-dehydro-3-deoxyphosphogluconate aldolase [Vagococcus elongatus]
MSQKAKILGQLRENYLFAVVRGKTAEEGYKISESCIAGGIKNIEVTYTTPGAGSVIQKLSETVDDKTAVIGAGTVLDPATANEAILSGAKFVVSPHFDSSIAKVCHRYAIPYLPGCGSVTEIISAMETGVDVVKLFPGGLLGASFIKDVHGPLPYAEMMPSGGVSLDNLDQWMKAGAWAVGVGSALTADLEQLGFDSVTKKAAAFSEKVKELKQKN